MDECYAGAVAILLLFIILLLLLVVVLEIWFDIIFLQNAMFQKFSIF